MDNKIGALAQIRIHLVAKAGSHMLLIPRLLSLLIVYRSDQTAMAVAGVCSCDHVNSNIDSQLEFR